MRSEEPDTTRKRILGLGDSVLYGGTWMDQDSLATTLFTKETGVQMLNISCGSWGPDNCAAYVKEKGIFGAKAFFLVVSSHDAYDVMSYAPVVGHFPNYPSKQYKLALWELYDRYVFPYIKSKLRTSVYADPDAQIIERGNKLQVIRKSSKFNPGFNQLKSIADSCQIPFIIYLHAEQGELEKREYFESGQDIIHWADSCGVLLVNGLEAGERPEMYHDIIHFNTCGQRHLANVMKKVFCL